MKTIFGALTLLLVYSSQVRAEATAEAATANGIQLSGNVEIRPTQALTDQSLTTEDAISMTAKFTPNVSLTYEQDFATNLNSTGPVSVGLNPTLDLGFFRTQVNNIFENKETGLSFSYENRTFTPTHKDLASAGLITMVRNYLKLGWQVSPELKLSLMEIPIIQMFSKSGTVTAKGPNANPFFENRVYLIAEVQLTKALSLSVPLMFHQTRHADFVAGASNNDSWSFFIWTWPEIDYAINESFYVGASYRSDNLIKTGLRDGVAQLVLGANL